MKTRKDIIRPIRMLARKQCASLHSGNKCHLCPDDQAVCSFFRDDGDYPLYLKKGAVRCNYFETNVLPTDPELELNYWGKNPDSIHGQTVGKCSRCAESFTRHSNRQQFCSKCKPEQTKIINRDRQRKKYWNDRG
ncbi:hypothetical protein H1230_18830 [Paenibacillus sp. 19GGS1-52]|uniref:hypothetical protein n=1 Tax=Paenibacillus sp. 19GGS1-52 TaxID=2758563 RepID=UPI001EFB4844|nr:hypothetical protein [Paenibacillus sp. 19GGS1-52]ULO05165.1 hypothetical protein H1230_18830 [Paenibacillus sp. 19GGS1-52]